MNSKLILNGGIKRSDQMEWEEMEWKMEWNGMNGIERMRLDKDIHNKVSKPGNIQANIGEKIKMLWLL